MYHAYVHKDKVNEDFYLHDHQSQEILCQRRLEYSMWQLNAAMIEKNING